MDFHTLTRRQLQTLCKKNKIPANITNVAMADALAALPTVEGMEEALLIPSESSIDTPATKSQLWTSATRRTRSVRHDSDQTLQPPSEVRTICRSTRRDVVLEIPTPAPCTKMGDIEDATKATLTKGQGTRRSTRLAIKNSNRCPTTIPKMQPLSDDFREISEFEVVKGHCSSDIADSVVTESSVVTPGIDLKERSKEGLDLSNISGVVSALKKLEISFAAEEDGGQDFKIDDSKKTVDGAKEEDKCNTESKDRYAISTEKEEHENNAEELDNNEHFGITDARNDVGEIINEHYDVFYADDGKEFKKSEEEEVVESKRDLESPNEMMNISQAKTGVACEEDGIAVGNDDKMKTNAILEDMDSRRSEDAGVESDGEVLHLLGSMSLETEAAEAAAESGNYESEQEEVIGVITTMKAAPEPTVDIIINSNAEEGKGGFASDLTEKSSTGDDDNAGSGVEAASGVDDDGVVGGDINLAMSFVTSDSKENTKVTESESEEEEYYSISITTPKGKNDHHHQQQQQQQQHSCVSKTTPTSGKRLVMMVMVPQVPEDEKNGRKKDIIVVEENNAWNDASLGKLKKELKAKLQEKSRPALQALPENNH